METCTDGTNSDTMRPPPVLSRRQKIGSVIFSATILAIMWGSYIGAQGVVLQRYYVWAKEALRELREDNMCDKDQLDSRIKSDTLRVFNHAPDIFLADPENNPGDHVPYERMADTLPVITLVIGAVFVAIGRDYYFINRAMFIISFLILMNITSEYMTGFPPSVGLYKCLEKSGAFGDAHAGDTVWEALINATSGNILLISLYGTCTSMMWSGHTSYTMLGLWIALEGYMSIRQPGWWRPGGENTWWITAAILAVGLLEAGLILAHNGHYTSDILVAIMLTIFATRSTEMAYLAALLNPCLPTLTVWSE